MSDLDLETRLMHMQAERDSMRIDRDEARAALAGCSRDLDAALRELARWRNMAQEKDALLSREMDREKRLAREYENHSQTPY